MCYHYTIPAYEVDAVDSGSLSEITARLGLRRRYGSSSDFLNYIRICREYHRLGILCKWSGKRGSNPPPPPWQGGALPNELFPLEMWCLRVESNHRHRDFQSLALPAELPRQKMAIRRGLEPLTSSVTGWHSNQLNYRTAIFGGPSGTRTPDQSVMSRPL